VAHGSPLQLAFWAGAFVAVGLVAWLAGERLRAGGAWTATWVGWSALAIVAAALVPGVSYPLVVPVLVAGVAGLAAALARANGAWSWLPPLVAAALVVFPMAWMLYDGMGDGALPGVTALLALVLTGTLPALATSGRRSRLLLAAAAGATVLVGAVAASALPKFTADAPQPLSLVHYQDADRAESRWIAGSTAIPLPPSLAALRAMRGPYPWAPELEAWTASAPRFDAPPPELVVESVAPSTSGLRVRARLRSSRGAPIAGLYLPGSRLASARIEGEDVPLPPSRERDEWQSIENVTLSAAGAVLELVFTGNDPVDLHAYDVQPGLRDDNAPLLRARPEWAVPIGRGDRSVFSRRIRIAAER
jgi:hypothetical protein